MNIRSIIKKSILELKRAGIKTPELDTRILLQHTIQESDSFLLSHSELPLTNQQYHKFRKLVRRRKTGEPVAYILGRKEFFGNDFIVNKNVLIPRPETEWLVEEGTNFIQIKSRTKSQEMINILDVGTGSGCIILSIVKELLNTKHPMRLTDFYASDISKKALEVAKKNAKKIEVIKRIKFYESDLFSNRFLNKKFDLIIANLPYVPRLPKNQNAKNQIPNKQGVDFEPQCAIFANDNGMSIIKNFLLKAKVHINPGGMILLESDCRNAEKIQNFAERIYHDAKIELNKDLSGLDRYIKVRL